MTTRQRILVVDDEVEVCNLLRDLLRQAGYDVLMAQRGDAAIALAQSRHPHLIILDVLMPDGLDGVQVYHRLKGKAPTRKIPVIFLTAVEPGGSVSQQKLPLEEHYVVIGKPFEAEELLRRVQQLLSSGT